VLTVQDFVAVRKSIFTCKTEVSSAKLKSRNFSVDRRGLHVFACWLINYITTLFELKFCLYGANSERKYGYLLTPWKRTLLEKLTGSQLVEKFPAFYGTRRFITAITSFPHLSLSWARSIQPGPRLFRNKASFYGEEFFAPRPTPKLEDRSLWAVRSCLFNIFATVLHTGGRSSIRSLRTQYAVDTGTRLSWSWVLDSK
jgi:hypothetical protein